MSAQRFGDVQFGLLGGAGEDHLRVLGDQRGELWLAELLELITGHDRGMVAGDADPAGQLPLL